MELNKKIFSYAKISVLVSILLTVILSIYHFFELSTLNTLLRSGYYLSSVLFLIVTIFIILAYIKIGQERKNKMFISLLYIVLLISFVDFIIGFQDIQANLFNTIFLWISELSVILMGIFFISLSKYYNYLKTIGVLTILGSVFSLVVSIIPEGISPLLSLFGVVLGILGLLLIFLTKFFEFKLFSKLSL